MLDSDFAQSEADRQTPHPHSQQPAAAADRRDWRDCFPEPAPLRAYQFRLLDLFFLLTSAGVLFGLAQSGSPLFPLLPLGASMAFIAVSLCDCYSPILGQIIGATIALAWSFVISVAVPSVGWEGFGLLFIFYTPLCAWLGGIAAVLRETNLD